VTELGGDGKINTDAALIAAADQALYQAKRSAPIVPYRWRLCSMLSLACRLQTEPFA
jgi:hypothetical protein